MRRSCRNPTFADYPFASGQTTPDGVVTIPIRARGNRRRVAPPSASLRVARGGTRGVVNARRDGLAASGPGRGSARRWGQPRYGTPGREGPANRVHNSAAGESSSGPGCPCTEPGGMSSSCWRAPQFDRPGAFHHTARRGCGARQRGHHRPLGRMAAFDRHPDPGGGFPPGRTLLPGPVQPIGGATGCRTSLPAPRGHLEGTTRRGSAPQGSSPAAPAVAGGQLRQRLSVGRGQGSGLWKAVPRCPTMPGAASSQTRSARTEFHPLLPRRRMRADDLCQRRHRHHRGGRPLGRILQRASRLPHGRPPGPPTAIRNPITCGIGKWATSSGAAGRRIGPPPPATLTAIDGLQRGHAKGDQPSNSLLAARPCCGAKPGTTR